MNTLVVLVSFVVGAGIAYYISLLVHEVGHLVAANLVGWKPTNLCIGQGQKRTLFRIRRVQFQLGKSLRGGMVRAFARSTKGFRFAQFVFAAGGPLATASLTALLWMAATVSSDRNLLPEPWNGGLWMLVLVECWFLIVNLWPHLINYDGMQMPNDGLLMWRTLWVKKNDVPRCHAEHLIGLVYSLLKDGSVREAELEIENASAQIRGLPEESRGLQSVWVHLLLETGQKEKAENECVRLLRSCEHRRDEYVRMLDALACIPLFYGQRRMLEQALTYIEEALAEAPEMITLKGTKASLQIEAGDPIAGMALLREVQTESDSENDQAISAYYLALGHHKLGEVAKAQEVLRLAKTRYPACIVASHVEAQIWASPMERVEELPVN